MQAGEGTTNQSIPKTEELCPFCEKKPIGHATDKPEKVNDKVVSVPSNLNCDTKSWHSGKSAKRKGGDLPYTLAQHHLISAMQCYDKVKQLVRMGNMVGYDINNPVNGIGLPTTHWTLEYPENGQLKKYGDLDEPEGKKKVAFSLMKEIGAQWHVGHHAFAITVPKNDVDSWQSGGMDEKNEDDYPHETSYDTLIINRLNQLVKSFDKNLCEEPGRDEKVKKEMNKISKEIKNKLEAFKRGSPASSSPFFVSIRAYEYSGIKDNLPNKDIKPKGSSIGRG